LNPDRDYSERPPAPALPAELEAQLVAAGCRGRDCGILTHVGPLRDEIAEADIEPMHTGNPDFDWDKVFLELDGELPADDETNRRAMQIAAETLKRIFTWMIGPDKIHAPEIKTVGTRAVPMVSRLHHGYARQAA
jgi:hypothetical protein